MADQQSERPLKRVVADFNNVAGLGLVKASDRGHGLNIGERVVLFDHEGNECEGTVVRRVAIAHVDLDSATWRNGPDV